MPWRADLADRDGVAEAEGGQVDHCFPRGVACWRPLPLPPEHQIVLGRGLLPTPP